MSDPNTRQAELDALREMQAVNSNAKALDEKSAGPPINMMDWQAQQKAMKEADRESKNQSAQILHQFKSTGFEQSALTGIKEEDREKQRLAQQQLHNYRDTFVGGKGRRDGSWRKLNVSADDAGKDITTGINVTDAVANLDRTPEEAPAITGEAVTLVLPSEATSEAKDGSGFRSFDATTTATNESTMGASNVMVPPSSSDLALNDAPTIEASAVMVPPSASNATTNEPTMESNAVMVPPSTAGATTGESTMESNAVMVSPSTAGVTTGESTIESNAVMVPPSTAGATANESTMESNAVMVSPSTAGATANESTMESNAVMVSPSTAGATANESTMESNTVMVSPSTTNGTTNEPTMESNTVMVPSSTDNTTTNNASTTEARTMTAAPSASNVTTNAPATGAGSVEVPKSTADMKTNEPAMPTNSPPTEEMVMVEKLEDFGEEWVSVPPPAQPADDEWGQMTMKHNNFDDAAIDEAAPTTHNIDFSFALVTLSEQPDVTKYLRAAAFIVGDESVVGPAQMKSMQPQNAGRPGVHSHLVTASLPVQYGSHANESRQHVLGLLKAAVQDGSFFSIASTS